MLYMPIGDGRFLYEHAIVRKANLYKNRSTRNGTSTGKTGEVLVPIREPMLGRRLAFADGKILPENNEDFDAWYWRLPIQKI